MARSKRDSIFSVVARGLLCAALVVTVVPAVAPAVASQSVVAGESAVGVKQARLADALVRDDLTGGMTALSVPEFSSAVPIGPGATVGLLAADEASDVYSITLSADQRVAIELTGVSGTNFDLYLYRQPHSLGVVASSLLDAYPERIVYDVRAPHAGTYYVVVERFSGIGAYTLNVATAAAPVLGPIHSIPGVTYTPPSVTGQLDRGTEPDHVYAIEVAGGQRLSVAMSATGGDADVFLFGPGATDVTTDTPVAGAATPDNPEFLFYDVPLGAGGTYYLNVWAASGSPLYELSATVAPTPAPGAEAEIPGVAVSASPVVNALGSTGATYVYALPAALVGERITLSLSGESTTDFDLRLFAPGTASVHTGLPVAQSRLPYYPDVITYDVPVGAGGVYYVQVSSFRGAGAFALTWSIGPRTHASVQRLSGQDRYLTAVDISRKTFAAGSCETVILATGADFPDALAASGLAGAYGSPVLLTPRTGLPAEVLAEMTRLGAKRVLIIGGTSAVGADVETALRSEFGRVNVERVWGSDRFATAAAVASATIAEVNRAGLDWNGIAFIVRHDGFADALAVAPLAYARKIPVLMTRPLGPLSSSTRTALTSIKAEEALMVGGTAAIADSVATELRGVTGIQRVDRIGGKDRFETAAKVAEYALRFHWADTGVVGVATGRGFADALSGGSSAGAAGGVLLLTNTGSLPVPSSGFLQTHRHRINAVHVYGGTSAVSNDVVDEISRIAP
ncbi:MAG: cell wall-binding repeat-containing protein [Clostridiales bacterium]|nr:cell wall-binding repeat-containing protein [Clostridiales bacterium]